MVVNVSGVAMEIKAGFNRNSDVVGVDYTFKEFKDHHVSNRWAIVLAGGDGQRMQPAIREWFDEERPKQYCNFVGTRSMLEHTWERASEIVMPENILTIVVKKHRSYVQQIPEDSIPGGIVYQPDNRGTAVAIYVALAFILGKNPNASVIVLPSDHFIFPRSKFVDLAKKSMNLVEAWPDYINLLGAQASWPSSDYGWIEGLSECAQGCVDFNQDIRKVAAFVEKPSPSQAAALLTRGAIWSTMIFSANANFLWAQGSLLLPKVVFSKLSYIRSVVSYLHRKEVSDSRIYSDVSGLLSFVRLPNIDFSKAVLTKCASHCHVMAMKDIEWDDWGRPERILHTIERLCLKPNFSSSASRKPLSAQALV